MQYKIIYRAAAIENEKFEFYNVEDFKSVFGANFWFNSKFTIYYKIFEINFATWDKIKIIQDFKAVVIVCSLTELRIRMACKFLSTSLL